MTRFKKLHRCNHVSERVIRVFTFFNGALKKKLDWCDPKNRDRSADGQYDKTLTKIKSALSNVLTHNFFNCRSSTNIFSALCREDSELLKHVIENFKKRILHGLLTCLKRDFRDFSLHNALKIFAVQKEVCLCHGGGCCIHCLCCYLCTPLDTLFIIFLGILL